MASTALRMLGKEVFRCHGLLMFGPVDGNNVLDVHPHSFVLLMEKGRPIGIFDSSVTAAGIEGIPSRYGGKYPNLSVALYSTRPGPDEFQEEYRKGKKPLLALYAIKKKNEPNDHIARWTCTTPLGIWLTGKFGNQNGLWAKVVWSASEIFAGRNPFNYTDLDKDLTWEAIHALPDKILRDNLPAGA